MENAQIAAALDEIADLLEIQEGNPFRVRSYRDAARTVRDSSHRLADMVAENGAISDLPSIGERTADKIRELVERGTCRRLEELRKKVAPELTEFLRVPGLGPKKTKKLYDELGVKTLEELREAADAHRVREVAGMGPKTEEQLLHGIENLQEQSRRVRLKEAEEYSAALGKHLDEIDGIAQWAIAGSYRRRKETIGDLDVLVQAHDRGGVADALTEHETVAGVVSKGHDKVRVRLQNGLAVDFLFFEEDEFGAALLYFTGSKAHNIELRRWARDQDWKLNEHGLFSGKKRLAGATEESVYERFGLAWVPPELRERRGELDAAKRDRLPKLIEREDVRGDLHAHTTASDGHESIKGMVAAARERGHEYLAITDHSKAVRVANGLDEERLRRHADEIREVASDQKDFRLLAGIEVDILADGALDLDEKLLGELDWVNASVHSKFGLSKKKMTQRVLRAIRSGVVHCIGHPLGRQIGSRDPISIDFDQVLEACSEAGVFLEINANPERLDLPDIYCQRAKEAGVRLVISTDAHKPDDFDLMRYGVTVARRGWLEKRDIVNTATAHALFD